MSDELNHRVEQFRRDFETVTGSPCQHFFCPILHRDELTELCKGHVVPESFSTSNQWVPQRADVDNFYGSTVEADFLKVVQDRDKSVLEMWQNPRLRKRHRPHLEYQGKRLEHYFPRDIQSVSGHTMIQFVDGDGKSVCNFSIKESADELAKLSGKDIQLVVDRDFRPAVVASVLKIAHLTLFSMMGYQYVFSPTGIYLADILRKFFVDNFGTSVNRWTTQNNPVHDYFGPLSKLVSPMMVIDDDVLRGTIVDQRVLLGIGATQGPFTIGVIIRADQDMFTVFLPTDKGGTIDTFFSFVNEPPVAIHVKIFGFVSDESGQSRWETSPDPPERIELPAQLPD